MKEPVDEEPRGHVCPECGAPRDAGSTPSCACGQRAADALRDTRTAEAAAAEDFDPLRIRPYVDIEGGGAGAGGTEAVPGAEGTGGAAGAGRPAAVSESAAETTMPLSPSAGPASTAPPNASDLGLFEAGGSGEPGGSSEPREPQPHGSDELGEPGESSELVGPVPGADRPEEAWRPADEEPAGRGRRPAALLAVSGGVVAVVTAAGFATGLFAYKSPARDDAAPQEVRQSVPDGPTAGSASATPTTTGSPSAPSAPASRTASASASPSRSASASAPGASPSPSRSASAPVPGPTGPTRTAPSGRASATATPAPVLRLGDRGPEVTELQERLAQLYLYTGQADGVFDSDVQNSVRTYQWARGITADDLGVYGPATRAALESETSKP
ncbi:peptidoglycan-binding domain-containing protein [Streptomyces naganishii]|uniref:Peptidoglycan-binding protein n=1 Tax=Streptomyces naganishii JCM 4654 TaxID=1306179 RepID=A0A918XYU0_9ACTN|nr:peptidoglycan-binding domain-containing protein [Streptomyces naganishii]GHD83636.1 peptidoglycan-binding protein [Streptomyces naganishii JCM 4654]